jgi:hypothetical protein
MKTSSPPFHTGKFAERVTPIAGHETRRNNVFLYHETLLARNVAFDILTYDLTWIAGHEMRREQL